MNTYAYLIKAKAKSDKKSLFCFFDAKSDSRAEREIANILEDAEIETGRGCDYLLPIRTNLHVVDDLPEERVLDDTWCDRYELGEDGLTWQQIPTAPKSTSIQEEHKAAIVESVAATSITKEATYAAGPGEEYPQLVDTHRLPFRQKLIAAFIYEGDSYPYHISKEQLRAVVDMEMDTDNNYVQSLLLAAENVPAVKAMDINNLLRASRYVKQVWPLDGKLPELGKLIQFLDRWSATAYVDQGLFAKEWATGNQIDAIQRTDTGLNAGGGNKTDRSPDYTHTLETLDFEIAAATLPMDFDLYNIPGSIHRRAKELVAKKQSPFKEWSAILRQSPGILDYSRAAIFALIRSAPDDVHHFPARLQAYISANLTEYQHDEPTAEVLTAARHIDSAAVVASVVQGNEPVESLDNLSTEFSVVGKLAAEAAATNRESVDQQLAAERGEFVDGVSDPKDPQWIPGNTATTEQPASTQPRLANLGAGIFSIDGLVGNSTQAETTSNVPMEETHNDEIAAGAAVPENEIAHEDAGTVAVTPNASTVLANAAPEVAAAVAQQNEPQNIPETIPEAEPVKTVYPEYFEPGRYEGIPNEVYHAANGISSTQVKDARVSLMYFHGRHVIKTIQKETSDALSFGTLVHTLGLEPEKFDEEFAVMPELPAGTLTSADSMKDWIRTYNADKPKADQLKLSGKKEDLQNAIRAVSADVIFEDEFQQNWLDGIGNRQVVNPLTLALAKSIQTALFSSSAGKVLQHPEKKTEVSYFGIDEQTGLDVRIRPDLELDLSGLRICFDLKTISLGKVKQDYLRAKLHREIIDRDYHISAAMYSEVGLFDQFFWIFVNKDPGYHWVAVVQASDEEIELGSLEYHRLLNEIAHGFDTGEWPAPITEDYTDELNDFDQHRLEALRALA